MNFFLLLQLTILAALKLTRAKAQNIIFVASVRASGTLTGVVACF
jgi:RNase P/RNase MRP subunit POP5